MPAKKRELTKTSETICYYYNCIAPFLDERKFVILCIDPNLMNQQLIKPIVFAEYDFKIFVLKFSFYSLPKSRRSSTALELWVTRKNDKK